MHETEIGRSIKSKVVSKQTLPGISLMRRCLHREPCCDRTRNYSAVGAEMLTWNRSGHGE